MKKLLLLIFCFTCLQASAETDPEIGKRAVNELTSCLAQGPNPDCAAKLRDNVIRIGNLAERIPAVDFANSLYELLVRVNRREISNKEDYEVAYNKIFSKYQHDLKTAYNQVSQQQQYQAPTRSRFDIFMDGMKEATKITAPPPSTNCTTTYNRNVAHTTCF